MEPSYRNKERLEDIKKLEQEGYGIIPPQQFRSDMDEDFFPLWRQVEPFTMISPERAYTLYKAVKYLAAAEIEGDFVECGVWKGGSVLLMALTILQSGGRPRRIHLFDTFQGMTTPTDHDRVAWNGRPVKEKWDEDLQGKKNNFGWWAVPTEEVRENLRRSAYPMDLFNLVKGDVKETIPESAPAQIALLRLDTDWYDSTRHELEHLYPRLSSGGILLLDDYGHFTGARKAVDEYFAEEPVFLHRDDYTGRSLIKIDRPPGIS